MAIPSTNNGGSSDAFKVAHEKMMQSMAVPPIGDTGKDPALKQLARDIVAAQKKEIAFMTRWQAQHGN